MGSKSDEKIAEKAETVLKEFDVEYKLEVASAHRNPEKVEKIVNESSADVFIAIAGLSAALPGVVASKTTKPVIGVPVESKLGGLDAVLSIVQMPPGIPVAAVGIDNGKNAALLAISILALADKTLDTKLKTYRAGMKK
jgi:5-(carboxyamino)imidazole ribonucleotide mutase